MESAVVGPVGVQIGFVLAVLARLQLSGLGEPNRRPREWRERFGCFVLNFSPLVGIVGDKA